MTFICGRFKLDGYLHWKELVILLFMPVVKMMFFFGCPFVPAWCVGEGFELLNHISSFTLKICKSVSSSSCYF